MEYVSNFVLTLIKQRLRLRKPFKKVFLDNAISRIQGIEWFRRWGSGFWTFRSLSSNWTDENAENVRHVPRGQTACI